MTYPLSTPISPGDATLASQYNHLRADAVHLGHAPEEAVALGQLLERYESRLTLQKLNTAQVRVPASPDAPVSLMVGGYLLQAVENVDLPADAIPSAAGTWHVFARRAASSSAFTLSISTSPTEASGTRRIGSFYFDGTLIVRGSLRTELSQNIAALIDHRNPIQAGGRLTLSTGVSVPTVDIPSASSLFYTPYLSDRISLYVPGFGWRLLAFSELSLSLASLAADQNYDIFIYDDEGTLKLFPLAWSNDTLRASALALQDGVPVRSGFPGYRFLGTLRTLSSGGACADSRQQRLLWNMYNRVERTFECYEDEVTWTYESSVWRPLNNNPANKVCFVLGLSEDPVYMLHAGYVSNTSNGGQAVGISLDCDDNNHANLRGYTEMDFMTIYSVFHKVVGVGYHFLQLTEWASGIGTSNFRSRFTTLAPNCSQWGGIGCLKA